MATAEKLAALALRERPGLVKKIADLESKVAFYERKERVENILKEAEQRSAALPQDLDLMKLSNEQLTQVELALGMITPSGAIKLGEMEAGAPGVTERPEETDLERLLRDPANFVPSGA